ncbi:MAG: YnbE family lipoprotein [Gammaproteobacteria bacterium]|nr:YnbE family lipoprotein [Gammaproteobacteria bacterium]
MQRIFLAGLITMFFSGCTPTIQVAVPSEPIEINLNVKIEHRIRIEVSKDLEELFEDESDIF